MLILTMEFSSKNVGGGKMALPPLVLSLQALM